MLLALGPAVIATAPSAAASTPGAASVAAYEARVIQQINVQRARYHRGRLVASTCPDRYAESWAAYLARTGRFYHYSMSNILRGCRARVAAENLARGNVSADRIVAAWMASPGPPRKHPGRPADPDRRGSRLRQRQVDRRRGLHPPLS